MPQCKGLVFVAHPLYIHTLASSRKKQSLAFILRKTQRSIIDILWNAAELT
jgi:hypothetical protein